MSGVDKAMGGFVDLKKGYAGMYTITNVYTSIIPATEVVIPRYMQNK
jgi:hypothetical protein